MTHLDGQTILVVEDEVLIGLCLEDSLQDAGATVVGPCSTVAAAMQALDRTPVDGASLDWQLLGETSEPVAHRLDAEGTPYVFLSGNSPAMITARLPGALVLTKPLFDFSTVTRTLSRLIAAFRA